MSNVWLSIRVAIPAACAVSAIAFLYMFAKRNPAAAYRRTLSWSIAITGFTTIGIAGLSFGITVLTSWGVVKVSIAPMPVHLLISCLVTGLVLVSLSVALVLTPEKTEAMSSLPDTLAKKTDFSNAKRLVEWTIDIPTYDSDMPPLIECWVGREREVEVLHDSTLAVIVVSGIGGQGKSALAAKSLEAFRQEYPEDFWDWRDCREEADRFRTQLINVLVRLSGKIISPEQLSTFDIKTLAKLFFQYAQEVHGLIVFDNVDHYTNTETNLFRAEISHFVEEALRVPHHLRFIFTCRPQITYANVRFREVRLEGLTTEQSLDLFRTRIGSKISSETLELVPEFCNRCEGHPLWLNLISAQIARHEKHAVTILEQLRQGESHPQALAMLRAIWASLKEDDKSVLRCMAELPRATSRDQISGYAADHCKNRNRFNRSFNSLKTIGLITEKRADVSSDSRFELHPLVRSFVKSEYPELADRQEIIMSILVCCDRELLTLTRTNPIKRLEHLVMKTELHLNADDVEKSIKTLAAANRELLSHGLHEELVRLGRLTLEKSKKLAEVFWEDAAGHDVAFETIKTLVELGREGDGRNLLEEYSKHVVRGTVFEIGLCDLACYVEWFLGHYKEAIEWGKRGVEIKCRTGIDTDYDCAHNLALARRDNGDHEAALEYFLKGHSLVDALALDHTSSGRDAHFFGNIGRCLFFMEQPNDALTMLVKSFDILEVEESENSRMNRGYAALWIGEALATEGNSETAAAFLQRAVKIWERRAPQRVEEAMNTLEDLGLEGQAIPAIDCVAWARSFIADGQIG